MIPKPEPIPGEWQTEVNQWGGTRRYRIIGGVKEYELELHTAHGGTLRESEIRTHAEHEAAALKAKLEEERRRAAEEAKQRRFCPFSSSIHNECSRDECALFSNGCALSKGKTAARDTKGLRCPFGAPMCRDKCALYNNGCVLTAAESED